MNRTLNPSGHRYSVFVVLLSLGALLGADNPASAPATTQASGTIWIALAGDSTVTDNAGWGAGFAKCMELPVQVVNLSRGGRSSGSFIKEGRWQKTLDLKPEYVLIQFGHNDQPGHGPERETDPQTTYKQNMRRYITDARAAGIKPVFVTSLSRREWGSDGKIHSKLQPFADAVKELGVEMHVPVIDLHARSIEFYEKLGKAAILELSPGKAPTTAPINGDDSAALNQGYDGTHLNAKGSALVGAIVAEELGKAVPELGQYVKLPVNP